jgi:inorganic triphosphatase YgiF
MSDLDHLLKATDDFAFLGLTPQFPLDSVTLDAAASRVASQISGTNAQESAQLQQRLASAKHRLADPVRRARYLLALLSGEDDANAGEALPDSMKAFQQEAAATADPASVASLTSTLLRERQARLDHVANVFSFPRDLPNRVTQTSRDSAMWSDLRVIDAIDQLLAKLS